MLPTRNYKEPLLLDNNIDLEANEDEKYDFVISIADGRISFDIIHSWLIEHVKNI
jgi:prophage maintenance system killer protein